jgi:Trypsin-like peptidase domain
MINPVRYIAVFVAFLTLNLGYSIPALAQAAGCTAPNDVCTARAAVFGISSFEPLGSAVRIGPDLLVTNRHVVADQPGAKVFLPGSEELKAVVVPTRYRGDLVLLKVENLPAGPVLKPGNGTTDGPLFTIGADVGRGTVRVYAPGETIKPPAEGKPLARLHHSAYSQPGNSGGALVDKQGSLVAITAAGGDGRNDAIPAWEIARLRQESGPAFNAESKAIGLAYRDCFEALDARQRPGRPPPLTDTDANQINVRCRASNNRQLIDSAGQTIGRTRRFDMAVALFETSLNQDPNAINTRLGLAVTLHLARRYKDEIPHIKWLLGVMPKDAQVLRFAIQTGKWGGDADLAQEGMMLLEKHHPQMAPAARRFLEAPARGNPAPR